jgi:hypothetical protein
MKCRRPDRGKPFAPQSLRPWGFLGRSDPRDAGCGGAAVNRAIYHQVAETIGAEGRLQLDHLLTADETTGHTLWTTIKADPGQPTLAQLRQLVARLQ